MAVASEAFAAPPAVTYLYPAGAQQGITTEVIAAGLTDPSAKVWASGKGVTAGHLKGKLRVTVAKDAVPGTYWLRAHNVEGASGLRPFIVGTLPEVAEKEPNDDSKKPQPIEGPSAVVNGKLDKSGDVDCFAVALKKGQTLVASLEGHDALRSPMDAMMQVLSADGFVLDENNDFHGLDPQIAFTAKKDGMHIVRVYAFPAQPDASIRYFGSEACVYRLTLTTGPFPDFAVPLAVGPERKTVQLEGWNLPTTRKPVSAPLRGPGETHTTAFDPQFGSALRVRLEPHATAALSRDDKPRPPFLPPVSVTGRIDANGSPRIAFRGKKGQPLLLQVESRALGLAVNPVLAVLDNDLKQLARADPPKINSDTALAFTPPADGVYHASVEDLYRGHGPRHVFLLRILSEPDYDLTVAADRFTIGPGKPTTIPVKVNRKFGFTKPVVVTAEGLPASVKVEVTRPAKPDPNTVTLSLTADAPFSGSFRLIGTVPDAPALTRTARFTAPEFDEPVADLWLTVTPAPKK
ncbi:MAG TPA: PPC domain-containing protein [Gemmata sp.]